MGLELDGKDIVFEERYDILYPNNVSLCESNCTMKSTDFDLERINCMCTYKEIMDFDRIDEDNNDLLGNPNFYKPTQSSANVEVIKCLAKIGVKEGLVNNEAFYIIGSFVIIELGMTAISFIHGIKSVAGFVKGLLGNSEGKSAFNSKRNNQVMNSTHRLLNNPPKKGEENDKEENVESNKSNIVIKKNIKMDYALNDDDNIDSKNEISEMSLGNDNDNDNDNISESNKNYNLNIKSGLPKSKNKPNNLEDINNSKGKLINKKNINNNNKDLYANKKAEFIPLQYNFKFFKPEDKGIIKQVERSKIPFRVSKDTKILLEGKKNVLYDENYLKGPFYDDQNIIEIIEDKEKDNAQKTIKFSIKNNLNNNDNINNNSVIIKKNNKKNEVEKSVEQENPKIKKKGISNNISRDEKDFIKIKKINPITSVQMTVEDYKIDDEIKNVDNTTSIYNLMRREHTYLRVTYEKYTSKSHPNIFATFLAEILDKIYFIKIFIFLKKFDIFSIHLALYMFYHILLLSLLCAFFTVDTIKKIWEESDFPTMNFYLLYGLLSNIIVWIFYRIFCLLLDNQDKIRSLVKLHKESMNSNSSRIKMDENNEINNDNEINNNKNNNMNQQDVINEKYEELVKKIKIQTIIFYVVILLLSGLCYIYLVSFFAVYTGTKKRVLTAYYISIIEIILIKFVYGLCLASLRIAGEVNELKSLYKFVYIMDKYVS